MPALSTLIDPALVRAAIDVSLTSTELPDLTIQLSIYKETAIAEIERRDPQAATRTGQQETHIKNALNLYLASILIPALPRVNKQESAQGDRYERQFVSEDAQIASLRQRVDDELATVLNAGEILIPPVFSLVSGCRGQ